MLPHTHTHTCTHVSAPCVLNNLTCAQEIVSLVTGAHAHAHPHTNGSAAVELGQIAGAEDTWWNHQSQETPSGQIKFVLVWSVPSAGPFQVGGLKGRARSFPPEIRSYVNYVADWRIGGRWLRRGCDFVRTFATMPPMLTEFCVLQSTLQPNDKQLEGCRAPCTSYICSPPYLDV